MSFFPKYFRDEWVSAKGKKWQSVESFRSFPIDIHKKTANSSFFSNSSLTLLALGDAVNGTRGC